MIAFVRDCIPHIIQNQLFHLLHQKLVLNKVIKSEVLAIRLQFPFLTLLIIAFKLVKFLVETKDQLISKCTFGVFKSPKKTNEIVLRIFTLASKKRSKK